MIVADYWPHENHLAIEGHAGSVEQGFDPVCCAASTIAYTLANYLASNHAFQMKCDGREGKGAFMDIRAKPYMSYVNECRAAFDMAAAGFEMLQEEYPGCIEFNTHIAGGDE